MKFWPLFFFLSALSWGDAFDDAVDFDIQLPSLNNPDTVSRVISSGKVVILEGTLADARIQQSEKHTDVWITLAGGAWIGTEEVISYSCQVRFRGESWQDVFIKTEDKNPSPDYIAPGRRLLVAAKISGYDQALDQAIAEMVNFRVLH